MSSRGTLGTFLPFVFASRLGLLAGFSVVFVATFISGCGPAQIGEPRAFTFCTPSCAGTECGADGCGGSCGDCVGGALCNAFGSCYEPTKCNPDCAGKECGADGCGGSCGDCIGGALCDDLGSCYQPNVCTPDCAGKECGADGCGGSCGVCNGGMLCDGGGACYQANVCTPDCAGKECGSDGCGGSCGSCAQPNVCQANTCSMPGAVTVFFQDDIQGSGEPWGFDEALTEYPVGNFLPGGQRSDTKANLRKVADPAPGGSGWAIRQAVRANGPGGGRSELGVWTLGGNHSALRSYLRTGASIFISMEMYLPKHTQPTPPDSVPWLAMYDIHPTAGDVWRPGWSALWAEDGSDSLLVGRKDTDEETYSSVQMPIGEWFTFEIEWSGGANETVRTWINGQRATTQRNVQTTPSGGVISDFETYIKVYTEPQGSPWSPDPVIKYVRNYQITDGPRFH